MPERVRLMDEYGSTWPVWTDALGQEDRPEWGISEGLRAALRAWAREFDRRFEVFRGWDDPATLDAHRTEGLRLTRLLQSQLGDAFEVVLVVLEG